MHEAECFLPTSVSPSSQALIVLQGMIRTRCPSAQFRVRQGSDDPESICLVATVDVDDPGKVRDLMLHRLLQSQVEDRLAISVLPTHMPECVERTMGQVGNKEERAWRRAHAAGQVLGLTESSNAAWIGRHSGIHDRASPKGRGEI